MLEGIELTRGNNYMSPPTRMTAQNAPTTISVVTTDG